MTQQAGDRQERERTFHDRAYGTGAYRERPANRFYAVARTAFERYEAALDELIKPRTHVLECGCGEGEFAFELARRGAPVTGIDISEIAIAHATATAEAEGLASATDFRTMDLEQLDLADDTYDVACGEGVLHHVDLDRALGEIARVLRPGGHAIFLEPMGHNPVINLYRRLTPAQRTEDEHPLTSTDLERPRRYFHQVETEFFTLLSLAAMPLNGRRAFDRVLRSLDRWDRSLFHAAPFMRPHAWIVVMRLSAPQGPRR